LKKEVRKSSSLKAAQAVPAKEPEFPIAAFGASAGGVETFTQLLQAMPADTGMGFVLVQHLDSKHRSVLADILQRSTRMPVLWVQPNTPVERNHVYVMPPGADLEILGGKLQLKTRTRARAPRLPIDRFFESLARDRARMAIGVVLSGTASDGTLGLKAIKAEGGITFAQSEASAKYNGMPASAANAGVVDYVLPPQGIARELARIGRHPNLRPREPSLAVPGSDGDLTPLLATLRGATGVDFTHYKHSAIGRRIARRMVVQKMERTADYLQLIRKNPAELQQLYQDIIFNVTGFFRDPAMFRALKRRVFPKLLSKRAPDDPVRIWVPACATGEEAYSIAIALSEYLRAASLSVPVQIFATDISDAAIERARAGVYPKNIAGRVPPELLRRYFQPSAGHFHVARNLREICVFARQNVIQDAPFSRIDLISCPNLMVDLEAVLQRRVIHTFHYALKPAGYLALGPSDTIGPLSGLFAAADQKNRIYLKKPAASRPVLDFEVNGLAGQVIEPVSEERRDSHPGHAADRILLHRFSPPGVVINDALRVLQFHGRTGRFLEPEPGEPHLNLLHMAREGLMPALRSVVLQAKKKRKPVRVRDVRVLCNGDWFYASIEAIPINPGAGAQACYLVLFEETEPRSSETPRAAPRDEKREMRRLRQELEATRQYLQSIIEEQAANNEELKSANEEIQSSNEELQSINGEMETAQEELQSANEELITVNEELQTRNLELARANDDLNNLISSTQIPLVMVDADGRIRRFTPLAERLLNLIPTDVGRPLFDIKPNVDVPDLRHILRDVVDNGRVFDREVQDDRGRSYSMFVRPYRTGEQSIDGAVMAFVDVTALRQSLEQSRDLREYAEALAATAHEPMVALDSECRVITANSSFYTAFHLSQKLVKNAPLFDVAEGAWDIPRLRSLLAHPDGDEFPEAVEIEHNFGTAGRKTLSINVRRLPATGDPRMILLAIDDISERRRSERALREAQASYSALSREAPVGILRAGANGECSFADHYAARLAGVGTKQMRGRGWMQHIHPSDLKVLHSRLVHAARGGGGFSLELRFLYPSGPTVWAHLVLIPLREAGRDTVEYLIALTDIAARREIEDRLAQAQKMEAIGRLAGGVAHDFNNLLTAISAYACRLGDHVPEDSPARGAALQINKLAEHAAVVTRQLLAFSRKQVMRRRRVAINGVLRDMHDLLMRMLGEGVEIELPLAPDAGSVLVDPGQIEQVILNLAINARDAMPKGGRLTLATERVHMETPAAEREGLAPGDYVKLSVTDTGVGMNAETRGHLFEPFFTTKPSGEGTGLGLSTAYGIIKQSGGAMQVETELHKGSTFRVYLPRYAAGPESTAQEAPAVPCGGSETILVVEDSAVLRSLIREMLCECGYNVIEARDGHEALAAAGSAEAPMDLLLTDVVMPGMNGHDLARSLVRLQNEMQVIYMSGYSGESLQALETEANFIEKPFKPHALAALVREVLDRNKK